MGAAASTGIAEAASSASEAELKAALSPLTPQTRSRIIAALAKDSDKENAVQDNVAVQSSAAAKEDASDGSAVLVYATRGTSHAYRAVFAEYSAKAREDHGATACFSFVNDDSGLAHELSWFPSEQRWQEAEKLYARLGPPKSLQRFGGAGKKLLAGYLTSPPAISTPPVIVVTRREAKAGALAALSEGMQRACDLWRAKLPGMLAATMVAASEKEGETVVHDLRIMTDWDAFEQHMGLVKPHFTGWFKHYELSSGFSGVIFSNDGARHTTKGSEGYLRYDYGPAPYMLGAVPGAKKP